MREEISLLNKSKMEYFILKKSLVKKQKKSVDEKYYSAIKKLFERKIVYDIFQMLVKNVNTKNWPHIKVCLNKNYVNYFKIFSCCKKKVYLV